MASNVGQPQVKNRGWTVTISATIALLMLGALYAWSVVKKAVPEDWGWSTADKAWPYSIALVSFSILMVVGGRIQDKRGPRLVITIGGILAGAGLILCGLTTSSMIWLVAFGIVFGAGVGLAYSSGTPPSVKWFPASRTGLISGIVVMGFGGGAVWVAPTMRALIKAYGIQTSMIIMGIAVTIVMVVFAQFIKAPPAGYVPASSAPAASAKPKPKKVVVDWAPDEMVRTWQFPALVACFMFAGGAGLVIIGNWASVITGWGFETYSAIAVSVVAAGNGLFRPIWGKLSDMFGRKIVLLISMILQLVAFVILLFIPTVPKGAEAKTSLVIALGLGALIGINYGCSLAVFPPITKDFYGLKNFGMNYGLVYQGWGIGGFIVSQLAAFLIAGAAGNDNVYLWAFYECVAILAAGIAIMLVMKAPTKKTAPEPVPAPSKAS